MTREEAIRSFPAADVAPVRYGTLGKVYKSGVTVEEGYVSSCCDMWNERDPLVSKLRGDHGRRRTMKIVIEVPDEVDSVEISYMSDKGESNMLGRKRFEDPIPAIPCDVCNYAPSSKEGKVCGLCPAF